LLLEPHLKEGRGGLRDYHTIRWIARVESGLTETRDLEYLGYLSHEEYREMMDAAAFVMTVRNCLHMESGRKNDHLRFSDQRRIAGALGYEESEGQLPVERFLGELHARMVVLKRQFLSFARETASGSGNESISIGVSSAAVTGGLEVRRGLLQFESAAVVKKNPRLLIRIFYESANRHLPLGGEAKRLIRDFSPLIDADYRKDPVVLETFEGILETPDNEIEILDEMLETGLLTTLFPEWEPIVNRIQYDEYHRYPVDRHSIRTVENVKRICKEGDIALAAVCKSTEARVTLLWAALFHDVGKGSPGREHSAEGAGILYQALVDRGFSSRRAETAAFLIREHLLLARTATRRDIGDEDTAVFCARRVGDTTRLEQLYLLTMADSRATGPKAWNPWTGALLRELFFNVRNVLEGGVLGSRETQEIIASKTAAVLNDPITSNASQEIERLIASMSPRYLLDADPEDIRKHIRLYRNLKKGGMFSWEIEKIEQENTRRVTICAHDQPGLLSMISGALTLHTFDILDVQVHTWRNDIALDIFTVTPPVDPLYEENKWRRATTDLADALTGKGDLKTLLIDRLGEARIRTTPSREGGVVVDNETSRFFTIIELFIDGEPGLLFRVTDALFRLNLDIRYAKIAAEADLFVLVFYVRDINGEKLDDATEIERVRREIERVVGLRSDTAGRSDPGITIKPTE
jgi:[protein-PII] uridylyltransferase